MRWFYVMTLTAAISLMYLDVSFAQGKPDAYPSRPVTVIVPFAPGGNDREARLEATKLGELLGQQFLIDYKAGAGSTIGTAYVAKAAPDGYTLLVVQGPFTSLPALYKDLPFDTVRDFSPVSLMSKRTTVLLVSMGFPAKSFAEYIAYAKANPEKINFGTAGAGATVHLAGAWLHSVTNTKVTFVHYNGSGSVLPDLCAGRVDAFPANLLVALPLIKSGKVRPLAIMSDKRSSLLPGLATIAEQGVSGYDYASWLGYSAPAGTPAAIISKLSEGFERVAKLPDVTAAIETEGGTMYGSTPAQFRQLIVTETARWRKVIQDNGITAEQ